MNITIHLAGLYVSRRETIVDFVPLNLRVCNSGMESSIWSDDQPSLREMHDQDQITTITPQAPQSKGSSNDVISQRTQGQAPKQLACVSCRRKKVKVRRKRPSVWLLGCLSPS